MNLIEYICLYIGLDKSKMIGDIGSRSFYMRKCKEDNSFTGSEIIVTMDSNSSTPTSIIVFPNFISQNFKKVITLSSKVLKILGCIDGWFFFNYNKLRSFVSRILWPSINIVKRKKKMEWDADEINNVTSWCVKNR